LPKGRIFSTAALVKTSMSKMRVLLTLEEFEQLAREVVNELQKIPLYDVTGKRRLALRYLKKVESIMLGNISKLADDKAESVITVTILDRLGDP